MVGKKDGIYHRIFPTLNLEYSKYSNSDSSSSRWTKYSGFPEYSVISQGPEYGSILLQLHFQGGLDKIITHKSRNYAGGRWTPYGVEKPLQELSKDSISDYNKYPIFYLGRN